MEYIDTKESLASDQDKIKSKYFLHTIYLNFYKQLTPTNVPSGKIIELGSGGGFAKDIISSLTTSDVIPGPDIDQVFSATKIPFKNNSISAYVMLDVFHHIKDPKKALSEMYRTLKPKGQIIMVEPWNSLWGHLIYKYLHHEYYNPKSIDWKVRGHGRMSDSNTALPWIVFQRDQKLFKKLFPNLKIVAIKPHTPFLYLISGGLKPIQLCPNFLYPYLKKFEELLSPINHILGMFVTIKLVKIK
ncbi:hypothetical protein A2382_00670 [Candidatus Woesebacteria bacterium RIFOXYB1_FULL_38_16]|uniref:Methyltransferase type 11 domain-containing protein n=1 Tax=Candidatus Woesebacteria bacterium RIFOXYB1_FULL_38_16 TaxID=1802538 RepID=A0A1F8CSF7_9BACT|nr:MAG: hypothetical protein A2191_02820 [Candidatus Woesebacteria bacterium RIFOXYA1_FULL_38_9]OGM79283.1 MAG: hypothetical protein A2382_00670 [Candidatus Woesebacteria bacterium RIFOXYB1_FULL_38_16]